MSPARNADRARGRRFAFQFLCLRDADSLAALARGGLDDELAAFEGTYASIGEGGVPGEDALRFGRGLVADLAENLADLSTMAAGCCDRGNFGRLGGVERTLLLMGGLEIRLRDDAPGAVVINEYVNLAKEFGDERTPPFVNGVLDRLLKEGP